MLDDESSLDWSVLSVVAAGANLGSLVKSAVGVGFLSVVTGLKTRSGFRWILLRVVLQPLP